MFKAERQLIIDRYGKMLWMLRRLPSHAAHWIGGVYLPPHERLWLGLIFADYKENHIVASRGTSKSFTHASFGAPLYDTLTKNNTTLVVSASGFRGGKLLFEDIDRFFKGQLRSQEAEGDFLERSINSNTKGKVISRQPDMWVVDYKSQSRTLTVPTNNPDTMRGIRATTVVVDERNTFDGEIVQKVIRPMMNVGKDFRRAVAGIGQNKLFQVSTIDYTFRDWFPEITYHTSLAKREFDAQRARAQGDWAQYEALMEAEDGALRSSSFSVSRVDYTDLLIPDEIETDEGEVFEVHMPLPPGVEKKDVHVYDQRDDCNYWYTYPVDKAGLEEPLRNGTMDEDLWMAEQRNVFISASGNVYPHELIVKASDLPIYTTGKVPGMPEFTDDFYAPVLFSCGDPCVIGLDYARESDEFAIVVIRLGPLSSGKFDPTLTSQDDEGRTLIGHTTWSNVIWAESWKHLTAAEAADKIRELRERYNIIYVPVIGGGIAIDKQGGGGAVRDNLAQPKPPVVNGVADPLWVQPQIVFDPSDEDYAHFSDAPDKENYWPGLILIKPTNQFNLDATMASKAMLQKHQLFIGKYEPPSRWAKKAGLVTALGGIDDGNPMYHAIQVGFNGVNRLKSQLVRLQSKVSETGTIRFVMPGNRELEEGKKDLYSAFVYATYCARLHLVGLTREGMYDPPTAQPIVVQIGGDRLKGGKDQRKWTKVGWGGFKR